MASTSAIVGEPFAPVIQRDGRTYRCVASLAGLEQMCQDLANAPMLSVDWETTTAELWDPTFDFLGLAVAASSTEAYYIPIGHQLPVQRGFFQKEPPRISLEAIRHHLGPLLEKAQLVMHNAKFDALVFQRAEIPINTDDLWDTYIAAGLVNETREPRLNLKHLTREWLGREATELKDVTGTKSHNMQTSPIELVTEYAGADACNTFALQKVEQQRFEKYSDKVYTLFRKLEMPIVPIVANMEQQGVLVNVERLHEIHAWATTVQERALARLQRECSYPFDPAKSEHVRNMLYDELCMPVARKGGQETAERRQLEVIFELMKGPPRERARPFFKAWCAWSKARKITSTYTHSIWSRLDQHGRIHPSFFQIDTMTGRMSSGRPVNFQNMPRDDRLFDVRSAFVPDPGYVFILVDYVQMEFKIAAAFSQDPKLVAAANDPKSDVHKNTARAIFKLNSLDDVTKDQRQAAKTTTYQIQYLCSAYGLSKALLVELKEAEQIINAFYEEYPGLQVWVANTKRKIKDQGFSVTYYGRRRWANRKLLESPVPDTRESEMRKLVNMVVQGTGADVIKLAMKKVARYFREQGLRSQILGQIHDELVILSPIEEAAIVAPAVEQLMTTRILDVTLPVEATIKTSLSKSKQAVWSGA